MGVDTPNPLWVWCMFSVQPRRQSMLIAASFRTAGNICATIISPTFFRSPTPSCGVLWISAPKPNLNLPDPKATFRRENLDLQTLRTM